jgi:ATP-binding protein involved in chromosome partitioning
MSVLGIVENMSTHICSQCGHEEPIFGSGGGARMAAQYGLPLLGQLPLDLRIRQDLDNGRPTMVSSPGSDLSLRYLDVARSVAARLSMTPRSLSVALPQINIRNS